MHCNSSTVYYNHNKRKVDFQKNGRQRKIKTVEEHVQLSQEQVVVEAFNARTLPAAKGGYSSRFLQEEDDIKHGNPEVAELLAQGFRYVEAEGNDSLPHEPKPFSDSQGRIFMCYAGMPVDGRYKHACDRLYAFIQKEKDAAIFDYDEEHHARGNYPAVNFGISEGNGKGEATRIKEGKHAGLIGRLRGNEDLQRIASFQDGALKLWAPKLYDYYWSTMKAVAEHTREDRNFEKSVFASATVNFGPSVRTHMHRDILNLAFGWCAITALGQFNHKTGSHLILWKAKLIVEFPPGSTYMIPSSCMTHSNEAIQLGEHRASFTQYSTGGIFRWVENGCCTDKSLGKKDPAKFQKVQEERKKGWEKGLAMFSTPEELLEPL